jgi:hypothetical protein
MTDAAPSSKPRSWWWAVTIPDLIVATVWMVGFGAFGIAVVCVLVNVWVVEGAALWMRVLMSGICACMATASFYCCAVTVDCLRTTVQDKENPDRASGEDPSTGSSLTLGSLFDRPHS